MLSKLNKLPRSIILLTFLLFLYGLLVLYTSGGEARFYKQILYFLIFFPCSIIIAFIDIRTIFRYSYVLYFIAVIMLFLVAIFGHSAMGAKRWISLGFIKLQPSEIIKISLVLMLARRFHENKNIFISMLFVVVPVILIIKQPDLGTGIINVLVCAFIFFAAGVNIMIFVGGLLSTTILAPIIWQFLHEYQKKRILTFLYPENDPLDAGYNIMQSKIAIGSGGFFGRGIGQGSQSNLDFLPEHQTDFIFACMSEELGFLGAVVLVSLYLIFIVVTSIIAIYASSTYAKLVAIGINSIIFCHVFINIGMVSGILPVVGVPLPFLSYGGTIMASTLVGIGLIMNVSIHSHVKLH